MKSKNAEMESELSFSNFEHLKECQNDLEKAISECIDEYIDPLLREYLSKASVKNPYYPVSSQEFQKGVRESDILFVEDYHPSKESKDILLDVLNMNRDENVVLAMEFDRALEGFLGKYLDGVISESDFSKVFEKRFGFKYELYRPIFDFVKDNNIPVIGFDKKTLSVTGRDSHAAKVIAKFVDEHYSSNIPIKVIGFVGGMHLHKDHLPNEINQKLSERGLVGDVVTVRNDAKRFHKGNDEQKYFAEDESEFLVRCSDKVTQDLSYMFYGKGFYVDGEQYQELMINALVDMFGFDDRIIVGDEKEVLSERGRILGNSELYRANVFETEDEFNEFLEKIENKYERLSFEERLSRGKNAVLLDGKIVVNTFEPIEFSEALGLAIQNMYSKGKGNNYSERWYYSTLESACGYVASKVFNSRRKPVQEENVVLSIDEAKRTREGMYRSARDAGQILGETLFNALLRDEISIDYIREELFEIDFRKVGSAANAYKKLCALESSEFEMDEKEEAA